MTHAIEQLFGIHLSRIPVLYMTVNNEWKTEEARAQFVTAQATAAQQLETESAKAQLELFRSVSFGVPAPFFNAQRGLVSDWMKT